MDVNRLPVDVADVDLIALRGGNLVAHSLGDSMPYNDDNYIATLVTLATQYRLAARERCLPYTLRASELEKLILSECWGCGAAPNLPFYTTTKRNEIDLIFRSQGYTADNVYTTCKTCRAVRGDHNALQLQLLSNLYRRMERKLASNKRKTRRAEKIHAQATTRKRPKAA